MLYKCANEAGSTPFRRLREGKLFQVETEYSKGHGPAPTSSRARPDLGDTWNTSGYATLARRL
jgi:hypothetical protein